MSLETEQLVEKKLIELFEILGLDDAKPISQADFGVFNGSRRGLYLEDSEFMEARRGGHQIAIPKNATGVWTNFNSINDTRKVLWVLREAKIETHQSVKMDYAATFRFVYKWMKKTGALRFYVFYKTDAEMADKLDQAISIAKRGLPAELPNVDYLMPMPAAAQQMEKVLDSVTAISDDLRKLLPVDIAVEPEVEAGLWQQRVAQSPPIEEKYWNLFSAHLGGCISDMIFSDRKIPDVGQAVEVASEICKLCEKMTPLDIDKATAEYKGKFPDQAELSDLMNEVLKNAYTKTLKTVVAKEQKTPG